VKAGLLPALFTRGVIGGVGLWRRVVFRPGAGTGTLFERLAVALVWADESGEVGLPELLGPGTSTGDLASHLEQSAGNPAFVFRQALGRAGEAALSRHKLLPHEQAALVLVVDQLEELLTDDRGIPAADRERFVALLAGLAQSGVVYVVGTLRGDFWHRAMELPRLVELSEGRGRLDLLVPGQAELAEMIRRPAEAAGLGFEEDRERGVRLDADLAEAASRQAGSLPLLSAVLDGLYREDAETSGNRQLTYGTYARLGKLSGAIAKRAEEVLGRVFAEVPLERRNDLESRALARVLRALATTGASEDGAVTARTAALSGFAEASPERQLVEAMLAPDTRLLVADGADGEVRIRVAHEALLTNWERARRHLATDRRDLETRARIEQAAALWRAATPEEQPRRLLRDLALAEAEDLRARWGEDVEPQFRNYISASIQAEQQRIAEAGERERRERELEAEKLRVVATAAEQRAKASQRLALQISATIR